MKNYFSWQITILPIIFIILTAGILSFSDIFELKQEKTRQIENATTEFIDKQKKMAKNRVMTAYELIRFQSDRTEELVRKRVKERVDETIHIANAFYDRYHSTMPSKELKEQIKLILSNAVFDHPDGYFFAVDMDTEKIIVHKLDKMVGYSMSQHKDLRGTLVLEEQKKLLSQTDGAFQIIYFSKPTDPEKQFPKQLYVRYFKPFNWLLGTGEYLDDMEKRLQDDILKRFKALYTSGNEYLFIQKMYNLVGGDGKPYAALILSGNPIHQPEQPMFDTDQDSKGNYFRKDILKVVRDYGEGFVTYWHPSPQHGREVKKTSFFFYDKTWNWTIGSGFYYNDLERHLAEIKKNIDGKIVKEIWSSIGITLLISIIMSASFFVVSRSISRTINNYAEKLEQAQKIGQMGGWQLNIVNNKLSWTDETYKIFGLPIGTDLTYKIFLNCIHPEDKTYVASKWEKALLGEPYDLEHRILVEGIVKWVREKAELEFDQEGKCIGAIGFTQDITSRKSSEQELRDSENRLKDIINNMGDWVWEINNENQYTYVSESVSKILGYSPDELLGKTPFDLMPEEEREKFRSIFFKLCDQSKPIVDLENWNLAKNGNLICLLTNGVPIINDYGELIGYRGVDKDITGIKKAEKEKKQLEDRFQQAQKMESIGTLAGGIAHDFNNILFPIIGHVEMLLEDTLEDSSMHESLHQVYTGALRARDLVQQILAFSRREDTELKLMKMQPIIKEALKLVRSTIPTTISINQSLQPNCGAIKADPTQIHQIIMNLATNAYHAMEETGGELKVTLEEVEIGHYDLMSPDMTPGLYARLTVADTGKGMNKEVMNKIFDPFFTTKEKGKGTGMGLSVVHGIVKRMDGEIQVHSEPDKGAAFHIFLPIVKSDYKKQELPTNLPVLRGTERVLLVDDEDSIIKMEKQILERLGYHVSARMSSVEALEAFGAGPEKYDIVITDMSMPSMRGDKLAAELIKIRPDIPILLCTGLSESITEEKIKSIGIKGLLMKPIVIKDLAKKIREVLDSI
jgi:PAS domain S-box-containing protein